MNKRILIVSALILFFAVYLNLFPMHRVVPLKKAFEDFPLNFKGWDGKVYYFDNVIVDKLRVSEYIMREYRRGPDKVSLYVGYYKNQKKGEQIHSPKHCLPGSGWVEFSEKTRSLDVKGFGKVDYVEAVYEKGSDKEMFIYWYKMKDAYITNEYLLKLYMVINSLKYRRNDAAFIRLSSPVVNTAADTRESIEKFMIDALPLLQGYLPD